jgi:AcrR family transcriptional regulator
VPTGVAISDPRAQLFAAAERVLLRDGPSALTSRAVTAEAGFAKGVLHRHFADFDGFLAELVRDRIARMQGQSAALLATAGTGAVPGNIAAALTDLFDGVALGIVGLVISRDDLRARLRAAGLHGIPVLAQGAEMLAAYLAAERALGRIAADADVAALAPMLIGGTHLLFAERGGAAPDAAEVRKVVATVIAAAVGGPG